MSEQNEKTGISVNTIVIMAAVGIVGFLANDYTAQRDDRGDTLTTAVRELELSIAPLKGQFTEVKDTVSDFIRESRASEDAIRNRLNENASHIALMERAHETLEGRVDRLTDIIRERSLDRNSQ